MNMVNGKPRNAKEVGLEEWKKLIDDFPYKLKEIYISGGEPTLMGYFSELINYITEKKILVTLFTNLSRTTGIMLIRSTPYFRIETTLHPEANVDMFKDSVRWLKELGYIVLVDEIDKQTIEGSLVKAKQTQVQELIDGKDRIRFAPDMKMSISCYDYYNT
jgi:molybdenum cofactor biosynthesis enzyme MoaA